MQLDKRVQRILCEGYAVVQAAGVLSGPQRSKCGRMSGLTQIPVVLRLALKGRG
jgi:hypothetical protein